MTRFPRTVSVLISLFASCVLMVACSGGDTEEPAVCGEGAGNEIGIGKACTIHLTQQDNKLFGDRLC